MTRIVKPAAGVIPWSRCLTGLASWICLGLLMVRAEPSPFGAQSDGWPGAVIRGRQSLVQIGNDQAARQKAGTALARSLEIEFPRQMDWVMQDFGKNLPAWLESSAPLSLHVLERVLAETGAAGEPLRSELAELAAVAPGDARWLAFYERAAGLRRKTRLQPLVARWPKIVFTKHQVLGGSHYAYTEGQSDAQNERQFDPGAALCILDLAETSGKVQTLLADARGVVRDPDVSWDGRRILFAWKKSNQQDDYHLYEWQVETGQARQLTSGLGCADYEGAYLPGGDILFNSTRCVQTVDCWWTEVSNLYRCDPNGQFMRRLTFDQVHDNYPAVLPDGRIIYTRWEYNDRGQIYVQGLFQMNPDGTAQAEFYGNNSWFPTSVLHARGIPGTQKVVAIFAGHHTRQTGKLGILDPARGRQENAGAQLIAPVRSTPADKIDAYGQQGELFQYPYPLDEQTFLAAYSPHGWARSPAHFGIYLVLADGRRELLAWDPATSCSQPVPLAPRVEPPVRPSLVDYRQDTGVYYLQDIYSGPGLRGIPRGSIPRLRVVALDFRAAGIGCNYSSGPAGGALSSTPISIGNGAWDVKVVLGSARIYPDGSACFKVPARTPVYFQALDERGYVVQTMRSWSTLQPGEKSSCVGCHESKNATPPNLDGLTLAFKAGPQALEPFYGPPRGFSFAREIQPVLDRHCVQCHNNHELLLQRAGLQSPPAVRPAIQTNSVFSLRDVPVREELSRRLWSASYLALSQARLSDRFNNPHLAGEAGELVNWIGAQSVPEMLPPYFQGAARSRLMNLLANGHEGVTLSREELEKMACWIDLLVPFCGDYAEANGWSAAEAGKYAHFLEKRRQLERAEQRGIQALLNRMNNAE